MLRRKPTRIELDTQNESKKFIDEKKQQLVDKRQSVDEERIQQGIQPPSRTTTTVEERIGYDPTIPPPNRIF